MWSIALKLLKFATVGLLGMGIDFGITWICKERLRINKFVANALGFSFAVCNNYILNRIWTFSSNNPQVLRQFSQFLLVSLIGLGINSLVLYLLHQKLQINFYRSKLFAIAVVFLWNFSINMLFTFNAGHGI